MTRLWFWRTSLGISTMECPAWKRRFRGAREVGFTVLSISLSLTAVFIPILLMGGILGRLFREFTVTLSIAILVSLVVLSHDHADVVRILSAKAAGAIASAARTSSTTCDAVTRVAHLGAAPPRSVSVDFCRHDLPERGAVHNRAQRFFSAARQRALVRLDASRSKHLLSSDE